MAAQQVAAGHVKSGMKLRPDTSWYTSKPPFEHVYVATAIDGLTSLTRVTIPLTVSRLPMELARTWRSGTAFSLTRGINRTSNRLVSDLGTCCRPSVASASLPSRVCCMRERRRMSATSSSS